MNTVKQIQQIMKDLDERYMALHFTKRKYLMKDLHSFAEAVVSLYVACHYECEYYRAKSEALQAAITRKQHPFFK